MIDIAYICIPIISLIAFYLKGITGTGTSTVIIALSSLIIDPKSAVILASFINIFGGISMLKVNPIPLSFKYWAPIAGTMITGSIIGAMTLAFISNTHFQLLLGTIFFFTSGWFFFKAKTPSGNSVSPEKANMPDMGVGLFAGLCGGFIGINAPPLILHFGKHLNKQLLRRLLVIIFIPAAIAQTSTFAFNGLLTKTTLVYGLIMIPSMFAGIYLGNKSFQKISEKNFRKLLAVFLLIVSIKLIWSGLNS